MTVQSKRSFPDKAPLRQCPRCEILVQASRIRHDCDDGYRYWSDGQVDGAMFPSIVLWGRCPGCSLPFAIMEAARVSPPDRCLVSSMPAILDLDSESYRFLVERALATQSRMDEKRLRIDWWRHLNDAIRSGHCRETPSEAMREAYLLGNLSGLSGLLDEAEPGDRLLKAELLRELGEFDHCMELLVDLPPNLRWLASHISIHAASGNEQLFGLLKFHDGWLPIQDTET
jgi:hypothetical protein